LSAFSEAYKPYARGEALESRGLIAIVCTMYILATTINISTVIVWQLWEDGVKKNCTLCKLPKMCICFIRFGLFVEGNKLDVER